MAYYKIRLGVLSLGVLVFSFILAPSVQGAGSKSTRQAKWEETVAAAKKEGQVNVYIYWGAVLDTGVFQKAYPEIKVVGVTGRGSQLTQRILAERRAGKYLADIYSAGSSNLALWRPVLDPIKPTLVLPEVTDKSKWWQGNHHYSDSQGQYVFRYTGTPQFGSASYNTKLVNPKEIKSFYDFLKPKWKGKIIARDVRSPGTGGGAMRFLYHNPKLGPKFISRLFSEMDVTLFRDYRQGTNWLATGKYPICFFCPGLDRAKKQGLPVESFGLMKEGAGLVAQGGNLGLVNRAPHPNAARVFINWFLSIEGQLTLQRSLAKIGDAPNSLRIDISKDDVPPMDRRVRGVKYLDLETPDRLNMRPILKVFGDAVTKAKKREKKLR